MKKKTQEPIVEMVPISKITVRQGWNSKSVDDKDFIDVLKDSVKKNGMKHPILLTKKGNKFELIHGFRRLKVHKLIKATQIRAQIEVFKNRDMERLAYIDLNIVQKTRNPFDLAQLLAEKEEIYLREFPSARPGIAQVLGMHKKLGHLVSVDDNVTPTSFAEMVEKTGGPKKRTTQRLLAIKKNLSPKSKEAFKKNDLTKSQAYLLTSLDNELQDQVVTSIKDLNVKDSRNFISKVKAQGKPVKLHTIKNHKGEYLEVNSWLESVTSGLHIMDNLIEAIMEQKPMGKVKPETRKEFQEALIDHRRMVDKLYTEMYTTKRTKKASESEMTG